MAEPQSYCEFVQRLEPGNVHRVYHDEAYGFPLASDDELFGRLVLEINQAGLSWTTILNKQENFRRAYSGFSIRRVSAYGPEDVARLLSNAGIVRNKLKVAAAIHNARAILELQREHGSFGAWLETRRFAERNARERVRIFKEHFTFVGGEIVNEFLMSTGYVPGAHVDSCPIGRSIVRAGTTPRKAW